MCRTIGDSMNFCCKPDDSESDCLKAVNQYYGGIPPTNIYFCDYKFLSTGKKCDAFEGRCYNPDDCDNGLECKTLYGTVRTCCSADAETCKEQFISKFGEVESSRETKKCAIGRKLIDSNTKCTANYPDGSSYETNECCVPDDPEDALIVNSAEMPIFFKGTLGYMRVSTS